MRRKWKKLIWIGPLAILGMAAFIFLGGVIVMLLWNWLLPSLFGWHPIAFWQAVGILALCRILFGGVGCHRHGRSHFRHRMEERFGHMTPEERERFRDTIRARWGVGPTPGESKG